MVCIHTAWLTIVPLLERIHLEVAPRSGSVTTLLAFGQCQAQSARLISACRERLLKRSDATAPVSGRGRTSPPLPFRLRGGAVW